MSMLIILCPVTVGTSRLSLVKEHQAKLQYAFLSCLRSFARIEPYLHRNKSIVGSSHERKKAEA
jgi:hypothetical protein